MELTSPRGEMPTMSCCISLRGCRIPTPTTSLGTCRKGCIGITVTFMDSPRHKSMRVSWGCLRLGERMATCRSSPSGASPSGTWQYNFVFDRAGGLAQLNNLSWPEWVSTIIPPKEGELENGTYRPSLAPVNFKQSKLGTKYFTVWYAGPLSINNRRGELQFIPSNLQHFVAAGGKAESDVPADPSLPDYQRDVQFTVNGQFQPVIKSKAGQTEIWVLANVSDFAYINVQLSETATGRHPPIAIVGQDGNPYTSVHYPPTDQGTRLLIPPASRFAIAVTIPSEGDLVLEMPERGGGAKAITEPGVLYTNNGTDNPPAVLGSLSVLPSAVSDADGFFVFPTQVLARATPSEEGGVTTPFVEGQLLGGYTSFVDLAKTTPDVKRQ